MKTYDVVDWFYDYGLLVGLPINIVVLLWDIPMWASRGFMEYSICWKGALLLMIGTGLCTIGSLVKLWYEYMTR